MVFAPGDGNVPIEWWRPEEDDILLERMDRFVQISKQQLLVSIIVTASIDEISKETKAYVSRVFLKPSLVWILSSCARGFKIPTRVELFSSWFLSSSDDKRGCFGGRSVHQTTISLQPRLCLLIDRVSTAQWRAIHLQGVSQITFLMPLNRIDSSKMLPETPGPANWECESIPGDESFPNVRLSMFNVIVSLSALCCFYKILSMLMCVLFEKMCISCCYLHHTAINGVDLHNQHHKGTGRAACLTSSAEPYVAIPRAWMQQGQAAELRLAHAPAGRLLQRSGHSSPSVCPLGPLGIAAPTEANLRLK